MQCLKGLDGAAKGKLYWQPTVRDSSHLKGPGHLTWPQQMYFKAKAYRLTPHATEGHLAIDGERYPYAPFQVEVHQRLGTTLGRGGWHTEFSS